MFKKIFSIVLFLMVGAAFVFAQTDTSKIKLADTSLAKYLNLTEKQKSTVNPSIKKITSILEDQRKRMEEFRAKRQAGEQPDQETMQKMRDQREKDVASIKAEIENIKKSLEPDQLEKFNKNVELPNLEPRRGGMRPR